MERKLRLVPVGARFRALTRKVCLVNVRISIFCLALVYPAPGYSAASPAPGSAAMMGGGTLAVVHRPVPPAAFAVLPDESVLLLDGGAPELLRVRSEGAPVVYRVQGGEFDPRIARLVDMDVLPDNRVLLLDAGAGTLWVASTRGEVHGRAGLFHTPTRIGRAPGGMVSVWDPGVGSVTLFTSRLEPVAHLEGQGLTPHAAPDGRLARIQPDAEGLSVTLQAPQPGGQRDAREAPSRVLTRIPSAPGREVVDAQVLGSSGGELMLHVLSAAAGTGIPDSGAVLALSALDGAVRASLPVPRLESQDCMGCSRGLWLARDGRVAIHQAAAGVHRFAWISAAKGGAR